jgi:hypothetical protein
MSAADRIIRWTTAVAVIGVSVIAAAVCYEHAGDLVRAHGETGWKLPDSGGKLNPDGLKLLQEEPCSQIHGILRLLKRRMPADSNIPYTIRAGGRRSGPSTVSGSWRRPGSRAVAGHAAGQHAAQHG